MERSSALEEGDRAGLLARFGRAFVAGDAIFREGETAREAFLVEEGRVRLLKRVRMVERSVMVFRPGDLFGESALVDDRARSATAIALTDGIALALDRTAMGPLLISHPRVVMRLIDQLIGRLRDSEDQIEIMMLRDVPSKIVSALLKLARATGGPAELSVTPVELSIRAGLDVDTVKRHVQRLRDQEYVRIVGERVEIPDLDALRRLYVLLGTTDELRGETGGVGR